jgi:hypothetical protein
MTATAYAHIARGDPVAGVIIAPQWLSVASALEDLLPIVECSVDADPKTALHDLEAALHDVPAWLEARCRASRDECAGRRPPAGSASRRA